MEIYFTNTLSGKKELFKPIVSGKMGMYNCGPTVYDYVHIGNLRPYVVADLIKRMFEYNQYNVRQIINITDIGHLSNDNDEGEDKMTKGLKREGKPLTLSAMSELADFYTQKFTEDLEALNIQLPTVMPKARDHIEEDIELIKKLEQKNSIYITSDGVYFDTTKDIEYGKLSGINTLDESQARIASNPEKKHPRDFALWKFNHALGFSSPWGKGFPGWHIECSAMSMKYLGNTFDIHTGGIDHIPVHHNNEIAQSETATGKPLAHYWIHIAFVTIDGAKMAKSQGNFLKLRDLSIQKISPLAYRYWLLGAHYKTPMSFSEKALHGAENAYNNLIEHFRELGQENGNICKKHQELFLSYINDDLDIPKALALVWEVLKDKELSSANKKVTIQDFDRILGLNIEASSVLVVPVEVNSLIIERERARKEKNWKKSDEIRQEIQKLGYSIKDTDKGTQATKIR